MNSTRSFGSPPELKAALGEQQYIANDEIATIMYLSQQLGKPLLTEGPAGVGKTELAKAIAGATGRELIRLQCYEGLDETKALYEWEYAKQLLYTQLLRDKLQETLSGATGLAAAADRLAAEEDVFFSMRFLLQRPLLQGHPQRATDRAADRRDRPRRRRVRGVPARGPERFPGQRAGAGHAGRRASAAGAC